MLEIKPALEQSGAELGSERPIRDGTQPLNSPLDPELIKEFTVALTVSLGSTAAILVLVEKILDTCIRIKKKVRILFSRHDKPIEIDQDTDKSKLLEDVKRRCFEAD